MGVLTNLKDSVSRVTSKLFAEADPKRIGIYGPPNAGKCLAAGEEVLLYDGTSYPIDELFSIAQSRQSSITDESVFPNEKWLECNEIEYQVPSLSPTLKVRSNPVSHVFRQLYHGNLYSITTSTDRSVTVSPDHPFITPTSRHARTVQAKNTYPGLKVAAFNTSNQTLTDGGVSQIQRPLSENRRLSRPFELVWDEIKAIDLVPYDGYIYDLTVPTDHTFTTKDGLVVHNTTLANRIVRDWTGDVIGPESQIPHETRRARRKGNVNIERNGKSVTIDVVDTPGVTTKVDYKEFMEFDLTKDDAIRRSREATEGVAEAMHWLREDVDGVIYVLDSTEDPFTQVNTMLIGIIESRNLPVLIFANKIDLEDSNVRRIEDAFPQHETVPLSALEGDNMDEVYDKIAVYFG